MKQSNCQGNILIVALILIFVVSGFVATALNVTSNTARFTDRSSDYAATQAAAEGAVEYAYGVWKSRILAVDRPLTTAEANAAITAPTFTGINYASGTGNALQITALDEYGAPMANTTDYPRAVPTDLVAYPGWRGFSHNYLAVAKMTPSGGLHGSLSTGVRRTFQYSSVPIFQSMYFFEHDIAIYHPATMIVTGLIHSNSDIYLKALNGNPLTIQDKVSFAGSYSSTVDPPYANTWSGYAPSSSRPPTFATSAASQTRQVARMEPIGTDPATVLNTTDTNPNNDSLRELIEPPNPGYTDPPELAQRRLYNKAGIVMNINGSTVTVTGQNGAAISSVRNTDLRNAITSRSTIYDQREGKNVDVATLDISRVVTALNAGGITGFNNVVYINDTTPLATGNTEPKTVRLINGGVLPSNGLTVASENPVYVQGDYNTGTTTNPNSVPTNNGGNPTNTDAPTVSGYTRKPAAVIADAVMLLSNSWNDSKSSQSLTNRQASHTTYNMAILAGFMPSGYQPTSGAQYGFSGGAINYPRFLEDWASESCTYYGSMVELFQSKTFTGEWDTGVIYRPPNRCFNFDTNFTSTPPPGTVNASCWSRGTWAKY